VVVAAGVTETDPVLEAELKPPGFTVTVVAPLTFQARVLLPPTVTDDGFAVKEAMLGTGVTTVTATVWDAEPALLLALTV